MSVPLPAGGAAVESVRSAGVERAIAFSAGDRRDGERKRERRRPGLQAGFTTRPEEEARLVSVQGSPVEFLAWGWPHLQANKRQALRSGWLAAGNLNFPRSVARFRLLSFFNHPSSTTNRTTLPNQPAHPSDTQPADTRIMLGC
ncbi:uncharacterized protein CIMG_13321 [Coccidioides immitis RS]|uniref:Uncharacterized protein n=1 Tax=Coccidioides immitis (strain RS) TaxID=246410 RepID=J3K3T5_COCIM|nr:uncharacterized protein CIMG_13321 [Coccidioides immitis RS]EAS28885.3 hypothetical protein CIMG_13321 [Coccidioides immitis RS]